MDRLKTAWKAAAGILTLEATLAGLTFATTGPDGKPWTEWGVGAISVAILVFLVVLASPFIKDIATRIYQYPKLKRSYENVVGERDDALQRLASLPEDLRAERESGRREAIDSYLASSSGAVLTPYGSHTSTGQLVIVADLTNGGMPEAGARFLARTAKFNTGKGVLTVVGVDSEQRVNLKVEEMFSGTQPFWQKITRMADEQESVPKELELVPDTTIFDFIQTAED